ncbi:hypothetical protein EDD18DRAFT_1114234 [Armillaria luteobubalina]|uniref:Uncharacterized protein n=1 Tax=Armillaria luteobubalina TaxID=153913 RepID=A0AA39P5S4_9AGAR|nr:hypothetical protein EDD18DRAFT_1114234 [Armillaria luteobubalina]
MNRDSRQPSLRYDHSLTPELDTFRSYIPSMRSSRPARSSRHMPSSYHHPTMRQQENSRSLPTLRIRRHPPTPATGSAFRHLSTAPLQKSSPVSLSPQLVRGPSVENKETAHYPASSRTVAEVPPTSQVSFLNFEADTCETPFQNMSCPLPMHTHSVTYSLISGIWALHKAPHSSRVHECTIFFHRPTKANSQPFNEATELSVFLYRYAGDDIPLDVHSLRDHVKLATLSESCKVLDSMVVEVNAGRKSGKIFLPCDLATMNETALDISQWLVDGTNTVRCIQLRDEAADVFILHASSMPSGIEKRDQKSNIDIDVGSSRSDADNVFQLSYTSVLGTEVVNGSATTKYMQLDPQMHLPEADDDFMRRCKEVYGV